MILTYQSKEIPQKMHIRRKKITVEGEKKVLKNYNRKVNHSNLILYAMLQLTVLLQRHVLTASYSKWHKKTFLQNCKMESLLAILLYRS